MITYFEKRHNSLPCRILSAFTAFTFIFSLVLPPGYAQLIPASVMNLPVPGTAVPLTPGFTPARIIGMTLHADNPLMFDFMVDPGETTLSDQALQDESLTLVKYFLASLTVPSEKLWVNLSPYEKDKIVPREFGQTEMGAELLAQDYLLKQLTASLMNPEDELGKKFWDRVYEKAQKTFGTTEIPMNTFNKIWILPEKAVVYANGLNAFVIDSRLKVMMEEDYLALEHHSAEHPDAASQDVTSGISSAIIKEVLLPEIEKEVNEGKTFAKLRQIYNSLILAAWYKQNLQESLLGQVYVDKARTGGLTVQDQETTQKIYNQYVAAFQKGVYNFIKEDYDPATQEIIPRKYFSGGVSVTNIPVSSAANPALLRAFAKGVHPFTVSAGISSLNGNISYTMPFAENPESPAKSAASPINADRASNDSDTLSRFKKVISREGWSKGNITPATRVIVGPMRFDDNPVQPPFVVFNLLTKSALEYEFGITIPWKIEKNFATIGDYVRFIEEESALVWQAVEKTVEEIAAQVILKEREIKELNKIRERISGREYYKIVAQEVRLKERIKRLFRVRYSKNTEGTLGMLTSFFDHNRTSRVIRGYLDDLGKIEGGEVGEAARIIYKSFSASSPAIDLDKKSLAELQFAEKRFTELAEEVKGNIARIKGEIEETEGKVYLVSRDKELLPKLELEERRLADVSDELKRVQETIKKRKGGETTLASSPLNAAKKLRFNEYSSKIAELDLSPELKSEMTDLAMIGQINKYSEDDFDFGEVLKELLGIGTYVAEHAELQREVQLNLINLVPLIAGRGYDYSVSIIEALISLSEDVSAKGGEQAVGIDKEFYKWIIENEPSDEIAGDFDLARSLLSARGRFTPEDIAMLKQEILGSQPSSSPEEKDLEKLARRLAVAPEDVNGVIEEYVRAVGEIVERIPVVLSSSKERKAVDLFTDPSRPGDVIIGLIYDQEYTSKEKINELRVGALEIAELTINGAGGVGALGGVGHAADFFRGEKGFERLYGKGAAEDLRGGFRLLRELLGTGLPGLTLTRMQISEETEIRNVIKDALLAASSPVTETVTSHQSPVTRVGSASDEPFDRLRIPREGVPSEVEGIRATSDGFQKGGIDLTPLLMDLQIKRDGNGMPLPLPMQPVGNMNIDGFVPVIIHVAPVTNLPMLLGLADIPAEDPAAGASHNQGVSPMDKKTTPKARDPEEVSLLN